MLGAIAAALARHSPALAALTLLPLAYRSLAIPGLVEATRVEPKTRLFNMRHFTTALAQELDRAARFDRPLALTVSIGVAATTAGGKTPEELVALADRAACRAKFSGRNTVAGPTGGDPVDEAERLLGERLDLPG